MDRIKIIAKVTPLVLASILFFMPGCRKSKDNIHLSRTTAVFNPDKDYGIMFDQQGNAYRTIQIGTQRWMAENLRTTKYRNGDNIPLATDDDPDIYLNKGIYCNYNNTGDPDNQDGDMDITMGYNYEILGGCFCPKKSARSIRCIQD